MTGLSVNLHGSCFRPLYIGLNGKVYIGFNGRGLGGLAARLNERRCDGACKCLSGMVADTGYTQPHRANQLMYLILRMLLLFSALQSSRSATKCCAPISSAWSSPQLSALLRPSPST